MKKSLPVALAAALVAAPVAAQQVMYVAHRGESADAPENTLASVNLAWQRGVPGVEIDVHLTKDGELVVIHDADTKRTTGVDLKVKEATYAELKGLDAGRWKGSRWKGEPLPTLRDVLRTVPDEGTLFIEVKVGAEAIPALQRAIALHAKDVRNLVIISFQADAVREAKNALPDIPAYYLSSFKEGRPTVDELIATAKELGADGLDLNFNGPIDAAFVAKVKAAGLSMHVWTVDDPAVARRMIEAGVNSITTNRGQALAREVAGSSR